MHGRGLITCGSSWPNIPTWPPVYAVGTPEGFWVMAGNVGGTRSGPRWNGKMVERPRHQPTEKEARVVKEPANVVTRNVRLVREAALIISYPKLDFPPVPRCNILSLSSSSRPARNYQPIQAFRPVMRRELRVARRSLKTDACACARVIGGVVGIICGKDWIW